MKLRHLIIGAGVFLASSFLFLPPAVAADDTGPLFKMPDIVIRLPGMEELTPAEETSCEDSKFSDAEVFTGCYSFPWIGQYIRNLYRFAVLASTFVAAIVLMVAGFLWLTAGGNSGQVSTAKEYITGAILGLCLMLGSYSVLYLINPDLTVFKALKIPILKRIDLAKLAADQTGVAEPMFLSCANNQIGGVSAFDAFFNAAGAEYGLDPNFLAAVAMQESSFNKD